jgi:hypothetical protein
MGLQVPCFDGLEEYVLETFERMYRCFERDRPLLGEKALHEIRYEDLVGDPAGELRALYQRLGLGDFGPVEPKVLQYFSQARAYRTNQFELPYHLRDAIDRRWGEYLHRYGYALLADKPQAPEPCVKT